MAHFKVVDIICAWPFWMLLSPDFPYVSYWREKAERNNSPALKGGTFCLYYKAHSFIPRSKCTTLRCTSMILFSWSAMHITLKCSALSLEVHTSVHFSDTLLLKCNALHSQVHCTVLWSAQFGALKWYASHCSVVCTALTLQCSSIVAAHALQESCSHWCNALRYCTAQALQMHFTCAALRSG